MRGDRDAGIEGLSYKELADAAGIPAILIDGARKLSQLQDSLASFDLALSAEQVNALDEARQIDPEFPYYFYAKGHVRATAYGGMRDEILA